MKLVTDVSALHHDRRLSHVGVGLLVVALLSPSVEASPINATGYVKHFPVAFDPPALLSADDPI
jgi:hypothetical protein